MQVLPIHAFDRLVSLFGICHFYKREPARLSGVTISNQVNTINLSELAKERLEVTFSSRESQISDVDILHEKNLSLGRFTWARLVER